MYETKVVGENKNFPTHHSCFGDNQYGALMLKGTGRHPQGLTMPLAIRSPCKI